MLLVRRPWCVVYVGLITITWFGAVILLICCVVNSVGCSALHVHCLLVFMLIYYGFGYCLGWSLWGYCA